MQFHDRREAGRLLGATLLRNEQARASESARPESGIVVLALPRGGVPVGAEVASALHVPLRVFLVRKLGLPGNPELAMGAIASGGTLLLNHAVVRNFGVSPALLENVLGKETQELRAREKAYGIAAQEMDLARKTVIVVDDGAATGATMRVAVQALRKCHVAKLVVALPTASTQAANLLREEADEVVVLIESDDFYSVGQWYAHFDQTTDEEVRACLHESVGGL
jgi:predicted phosphoribosyltransferase